MFPLSRRSIAFDGHLETKQRILAGESNRDKTPNVLLPEPPKQKESIGFLHTMDVYTYASLISMEFCLCRTTAVIGYGVFTYVPRRVHRVWVVFKGFGRRAS